MTRMIALVADATDVAMAAAGGVSRVAVRIERDRASGATDLGRLAAVGAAARDRCAVSLWWPEAGTDLLAAVAACGADEVWGSGAPDGLSDVSRWAVVAPGQEGVGAAAHGWSGIVITGSDGPPRLLQAVAVSGLDAQAGEARALGLAVRISGSMEAPDVPRLLALAPDALVLGDLLRRESAPQGALDPEKVRLAAGLFDVGENERQRRGDPAPPADPDLIFVRGWTVPLHLGAYRHEGAAQRVRFSVEAEVARPTGRAADMRDVVTYDLLTDAIARATVGHVALVETIAEDVAALVLAHPRIAAVDITVEKLDLGPGSLGCRIRRRRARS